MLDTVFCGYCVFLVDELGINPEVQLHCTAFSLRFWGILDQVSTEMKYTSNEKLDF